MKLKQFFYGLSLILTVYLLSCSGQKQKNIDEHHHDSESVTHWNEKYEIFCEYENLIPSHNSEILLYITELNDISPLNNNTHIILKTDSGNKIKLETVQNGIFRIRLHQLGKGNYEFSLFSDSVNDENILISGEIQMGTETNPGSVIFEDEHTHLDKKDEHVHAEGDSHQNEGNEHVHEEGDSHQNEENEHVHKEGEQYKRIEFLKEQQWKSDFITQIAEVKTIYTSVHAFGKILPKAGNEIILTSSVDAVVISEHWPIPGQLVNGGLPLFQLIPVISSDISLSSLKTKTESLKNELKITTGRVEKLRQLYEKGSVSRWEYEDILTTKDRLENQYQSSLSDLKTASALRNKSTQHKESLSVNAPFRSSVVHVKVTPGQYVSAGTELVHLISPNPITLEMFLSENQKQMMSDHIHGLYLRSSSDTDPFFVDSSNIKLLSVAPEANPETGKISAFFELNLNQKNVSINTMVQAELLLDSNTSGVTIPAGSIVDDGGVDIVYVQKTGEAFERKEIQVKRRQGNTVLVNGINPGERVVSLGGQLLKRIELIGNASFAGHGHAH